MKLSAFAPVLALAITLSAFAQSPDTIVDCKKDPCNDACPNPPPSCNGCGACGGGSVRISVSGAFVSIQNTSKNELTAVHLIGNSDAVRRPGWTYTGHIVPGGTRITHVTLNPLPTSYAVDAALFEDGTVQGPNNWHLDGHLRLRGEAQHGGPIHPTNAEYWQAGDGYLYAKMFAEQYPRPDGSLPEIVVMPDLALPGPYAHFTFGPTGVGTLHTVTIGLKQYVYREQTGDSGSLIANALCQLIDHPGDPSASCSASGATITLTAFSTDPTYGIYVIASDGNQGVTIYPFGRVPGSVPQIVGWATVSDVNGSVAGGGSWVQDTIDSPGFLGAYGTGACSPQPNLWMPGKVTVYVGVEITAACLYGQLYATAFQDNQPPPGTGWNTYNVAWASSKTIDIAPPGSSWAVDSCIHDQNGGETGLQDFQP